MTATKTDTARLMDLLRTQYQKYDELGDIEIDPAVLASRVMDVIDPDHQSPIMVRLAAHLELRQLARSICRAHVEADEDAVEQNSLFEDQLQRRYPATRIGKEVYVLRDHLTLHERNDNITRLRKEAAAKARHADALQSETDSLVALGKLAEAA